MTQLYDAALAPTGLRSTQYSIVVEVDQRQKDPPTLQELADILVLDRSSLGHMLRPLERDGLVAMLEGQDDRRRRHIVLTARGRALKRKAQKHWLAAQERFVSAIGKEKADEMRMLMLSIAYDERLASAAGDAREQA